MILKKKLLSTILSAALIASNTAVYLPVSASAEINDELSVTVSFEGLTLGQGLYFEPETYTLSEINELVDGDYTEDDLTAAIATYAFMLDHDVDYTMTGDWTSGAYLSSIKNIDKGYTAIPEVITENSGISDDENDGNADDYLGEFDYSFMSGWMITVNDFMIDVGASDWIFTDSENQGKYVSDVENNYVVRWQFTLYGYGADLGIDTGWGMPAYFDGAKKANLYAAYAKSIDAEKKKSALAVMENLTATQAEVDAAYELLITENSAVTAENALSDGLAKLAETVTEPQFGTGAGEWSVLCLARSGFYDKDSTYFADYYSRIVNTVNETAAKVNLNGALHKSKSTDNSRLIIALSAIGRDARCVGNYNLIKPFDDFNWIKKQGINGPIFALIALDTNNYQTTDTTIRQQCIEFILSKELENGGWALSGKNPDPDITSMALQALAPYKNDENIKPVIERAVAVLSAMQNENGGYASWGSVNAESIAQVITACTALGINPNTDARFIKNGNSIVDALLAFYNADTKNFSHVIGDGGNAMATDQCLYALTAYQRMNEGKSSLYDMSDVEFIGNRAEIAGVSLDIDEKIIVNFYCDVDEKVLEDETVKMQFTLPNGKKISTPVSEAVKTNEGGKQYFVFSCGVAAKEMTATITAEILSADGKSYAEYSYSVIDYAKAILNGDYDENTKTFVKSMLNYGGYSQEYFGYNTENLANKDIDGTLGEVDGSKIEDKKSVGSLPDGITYYGTSLLLENEIIVRHYFKLTDNSLAKTYNLKENHIGWYLDCEPVSAANLGKQITTKIGDYTIVYSPMNYVKLVAANTEDTKLKNVCAALYEYWQAAEQLGGEI